MQLLGGHGVLASRLRASADVRDRFYAQGELPPPTVHCGCFGPVCKHALPRHCRLLAQVVIQGADALPAVGFTAMQAHGCPIPVAPCGLRAISCCRYGQD